MPLPPDEPNPKHEFLDIDELGTVPRDFDWEKLESRILASIPAGLDKNDARDKTFHEMYGMHADDFAFFMEERPEDIQERMHRAMEGTLVTKTGRASMDVYPGEGKSGYHPPICIVDSAKDIAMRMGMDRRLLSAGLNLIPLMVGDPVLLQDDKTDFAKILESIQLKEMQAYDPRMEMPNNRAGRRAQAAMDRKNSSPRRSNKKGKK